MPSGLPNSARIATPISAETTFSSPLSRRLARACTPGQIEMTAEQIGSSACSAWEEMENSK